MKPKYKFGLIGHRIGYSRSPSIYKAVFDYLEVDGSFENFDLTSDELKAAFSSDRFAGVSGLSVTIPHKQAVIELLDKVDPVAGTLQAVNSVAFGKNGTFGCNTDWIGFVQPLGGYKKRLNGKSAVVFGYGGSAKAVIYALYLQLNIRKIEVIGRNLSKAKENLKELWNQLDGLTIQYSTKYISETPTALIVNGTPLGGFNHPDRSILPSDLALDPATIYYDLNYNVDNQTIARLRKQGLTAIDGSAMLVAQALESLKLWTGDLVPFEPIYKAVFGTT